MGERIAYFLYFKVDNFLYLENFSRSMAIIVGVGYIS